MKIYKFGGASIKDANSVRNVLRVLQVAGAEDCLIVASAMGKTTNALEEVVQAFINKENWEKPLTANFEYHLQILKGLFDNEQVEVFGIVKDFYAYIRQFFKENTSDNPHFIYDQVVCCGELISTSILSAFLNQEGIENKWIDARKLIQTDDLFREGQVFWESTEQQIRSQIKNQQLYITQGFIGGTIDGHATTLGREGSDYTAAIFAYCLDASSVTIWKDVPGVLNADPNLFENTTLLKQISYQEAIEMAFYGASIIHPKTLQPLQKKEIPLFVKSFVHPELPGTAVSKGADLVPYIPCFIMKKNQLLISFSSKSFSFIMEHQVSELFQIFAKYHIKVNIIQNTAISFSVCVEDKYKNFPQLLSALNDKYKIRYNENVQLMTIRHFDEQNLKEKTTGKTILLKQINRDTAQIVIK